MKRTRNILLTIVMILALLLFSLYDAFFAAPRNTGFVMKPLRPKPFRNPWMA